MERGLIVNFQVYHSKMKLLKCRNVLTATAWLVKKCNLPSSLGLQLTRAHAATRKVVCGSSFLIPFSGLDFGGFPSHPGLKLGVWFQSRFYHENKPVICSLKISISPFIFVEIYLFSPAIFLLCSSVVLGILLICISFVNDIRCSRGSHQST